jgi:hypothetical protein
MRQVVPNLTQMPNPKIHLAKRWIQRNYIYFYRKFIDLDGMEKKNFEHEAEALQICKKLIKSEDSILLMAPISGKRFVKNEKRGIYIIIEGHNVKVINHIYSYNVYLGEKSWNKLISFYDDEIEQRRMRFEAEITSNIKHSLKNILIEIDEKF